MSSVLILQISGDEEGRIPHLLFFFYHRGIENIEYFKVSSVSSVSPWLFSRYGAGAAMVKMVLRIFSKVSRSSPLPTHFPSPVLNDVMGCVIYDLIDMVINWVINGVKDRVEDRHFDWVLH
jgi:hypothetical protein